MWAQIGMALLKSHQDQKNRQQDLASNVITQKYSPWTGARADFSSQGKNNTISNLMAGYGAGKMQGMEEDKFALMKDYLSKPEASVAPAASAAPARAQSVFRQPTAPAMAPDRGPAVDVAGNGPQPFPLMESVLPYHDPTPFMLQGQSGENPWLALSKSQLISGKNDPRKVNPTGMDDSIWSRR